MNTPLSTQVRLVTLATSLFAFTTLTATMTVQAQSVAPNSPYIQKLSNTVIYSDNFINSTSKNWWGGPTDNFTYSSNSGVNAYYTSVGANSNTVQWATMLNGQNGWTNLGIQGGTEYGPGVVYRNQAISFRGNPNNFALGGDSYFSSDINNSVTYPQNQTTYIARSAVTPFNQIHFDTTFLIYAASPNSNGQWDTLGWSLLNSAGRSLMSINLDTADDGATWNLSATPYGSNNKQALFKSNGTPIAGFNNNSYARIGFNIFNLGETNSTIQVLKYNGSTSSTNYNYGWSTNYTILGNNIIDGGTNSANIAGGNSISQLAATWTLASSDNQLYTNDGVVTTGFNNYADNSLVMSTLLISVPEPQTWVLLGLSGLIVVVAIRRRANS
jgi:PEP-CTERM motif